MHDVIILMPNFIGFPHGQHGSRDLASEERVSPCYYYSDGNVYRFCIQETKLYLTFSPLFN